MDRMKTFFKYLILFIAFYIFTDVLISIALSNNYKPMYCTKIETPSYVTTINTAKATSVSGYIKGTISLNENSQNQNRYMQIDFYSKYGHCIGRKYVDLISVNSSEAKDFKVNFEYANIETYQITTTNEVEKLSEVQTDMISKGYFSTGVVGVLLVLYYVL